MSDPFDSFRKTKGAAFITRMKARAQEREDQARQTIKAQQEEEEKEDS